MVYGKKYGIATVFGLMTGCIMHTTLVAFGVSEIIKQNTQLFFIIKLFGAIYLLYLSYKVFKSSSEINIEQSFKKESQKKLFIKGFLMNVLNPKVTVFFLAFFPQFLFSKTLPTISQFYVLGGIFIVVSFTVFSTIAILSDSIAIKLKKNSNIGIYLKWLQILVFITIAGLIFI